MQCLDWTHAYCLAALLSFGLTPLGCNDVLGFQEGKPFPVDAGFVEEKVDDGGPDSRDATSNSEAGPVPEIDGGCQAGYVHCGSTCVPPGGCCDSTQCKSGESASATFARATRARKAAVPSAFRRANAARLEIVRTERPAKTERAAVRPDNTNAREPASATSIRSIAAPRARLACLPMAATRPATEPNVARPARWARSFAPAPVSPRRTRA